MKVVGFANYFALVVFPRLMLYSFVSLISIDHQLLPIVPLIKM